MDRVAAHINGFGPHVLVDICGLHANGTLIYRWKIKNKINK